MYLYSTAESLITKRFEEKLFEADLKNNKPYDEISVFFDTMNFYEKHMQSLDSALISTKDDLKTKSTILKIKRPSSNDELLRCAMPSKQVKKPKSKPKTKQNQDFKFL